MKRVALRFHADLCPPASPTTRASIFLLLSGDMVGFGMACIMIMAAIRYWPALIDVRLNESEQAKGCKSSLTAGATHAIQPGSTRRNGLPRRVCVC